MKKILIIGAGFLQTFVIKKAREMGYFVCAVDADQKAPGFTFTHDYAVINIVDEKACLAYAQQQQVDGVLTAATDFGVLTAAYIAQEMDLPGLRYDVAKVIKNKYLTRHCLSANNVDDTKESVEVREGSDIDLISEQISYPVMVKPCDGSGSRGASRVDRREDLAVACVKAIESSLSGRATIEEFIFGEEYGAETLVINGEPYVFAIMKKWMTNPPYYAELGHAIPNDLPVSIDNKAKSCVKNAIKALGINFGSVNMDMLITEDGDVHIVDVGARMGGNLIGSHIIKAGTGIDYMGAMIQNAVGDVPDLTIGNHCAVATRLLAFHSGKIEELPNFDELEKVYNVVIEHHLHKGDIINEYHTNLDGCGYVIAMGANIDEAVQRAEKVREEIESYIRI